MTYDNLYVVELVAQVVCRHVSLFGQWLLVFELRCLGCLMHVFVCCGVWMVVSVLIVFVIVKVLRLWLYMCALYVCAEALSVLFMCCVCPCV